MLKMNKLMFLVSGWGAYLKIADVEVILVNSDVRGLNHEICTFEESKLLAIVRVEYEDGGLHGVNDDNHAVGGGRESSHNVDKANADTTQEHAPFVEDLKK